MTSFPWIFVYCLLIVAGSFAGGWLPSLVRLSHTAMQVIISFIGGLMLGVSLFHLLPHGVVLTGSLDRAMGWLVAGLLTMFFLIRLFHFHQHGTAEGGPDDLVHHAGEHDHDCGRHESAVDGRAAHRLSWVGVAIGLAIHSLIDGVALGAAVVSEASGAAALPGFGIFLVVVLHKPLDALSITSLMAAGGWPARLRQVVNIGFAAMCPLGAGLFVLGASKNQGNLVGCALAFSAGVFLCISLGDLLPELHFHTHDRLKLSAALLLGIAIAYGIGALEPHAHELPGHAAPHDHARAGDSTVTMQTGQVRWTSRSVGSHASCRDGRTRSSLLQDIPATKGSTHPSPDRVGNSGLRARLEKRDQDDQQGEPHNPNPERRRVPVIVTRFRHRAPRFHRLRTYTRFHRTQGMASLPNRGGAGPGNS